MGFWDAATRSIESSQNPLIALLLQKKRDEMLGKRQEETRGYAEQLRQKLLEQKAAELSGRAGFLDERAGAGTYSTSPDIAKMLELGFTVADIKSVNEQQNEALFRKRLPDIRAGRQEKDLLSSGIVPGLEPGNPLAYQKDEAPFEIQEMLKLAAEKSQQARLTQGDELKGREASEKEASDKFIGQMIMDAFKKGTVPQGTDPAVVGRSSSGLATAGLKPLAPDEQRYTEWSLKPENIGQGRTDFQQFESDLAAKAALKQKKEGLKATAFAPAGQAAWASARKELKGAYGTSGLYGVFFDKEGANKDRNNIAQGHFVKLKNAYNAGTSTVGPLEAIQKSKAYVANKERVFLQTIKTFYNDRNKAGIKAAKADFRAVNGYLPEGETVEEKMALKAEF